LQHLAYGCAGMGCLLLHRLQEADSEARQSAAEYDQLKAELQSMHLQVRELDSQLASQARLDNRRELQVGASCDPARKLPERMRRIAAARFSLLADVHVAAGQRQAARMED
jgi:hypothetical protein